MLHFKVDTKDPNNDMVTLTYAGGLLTSVSDTFARQLTFAYNPQKKLISVTDPLGRQNLFAYDATGKKMTGITRPTGGTLQYSYNFLYQLTGKVDEAGRTFTYGYAGGKPVSSKDGTGATQFALRAHPESPFQAILWRGDLLGYLLEWASSDLRPT